MDHAEPRERSDKASNDPGTGKADDSAELKLLFQATFDERIAKGDPANKAAAHALRVVKEKMTSGNSEVKEKISSATDESKDEPRSGESTDQSAAMEVTKSTKPSPEWSHNVAIDDEHSSLKTIQLDSSERKLQSQVELVPHGAKKRSKANTEEHSPAQVLAAIEQGLKSGSYTIAIRLIGKVFSDRATLGKFFYSEKDGVPMIDIRAIQQLYSAVLTHDALKNPLEYALWGLASGFSADKIETLKDATGLLVGILAPMFYCDSGPYENTLGLLFKGLINRSTKEGRKALLRYVKTLPKEDFDFILEITQSFLTIKLLRVEDWREAEYKHFRHPIEFLDILYQANESLKYHNWRDFYQDGINQFLASDNELLRFDHINWFLNRVAGGTIEGIHVDRDHVDERVSYCEYPYLLDAASKAQVLELEVQELQALKRRVNDNRIILLTIRRNRIVDDALDQVRSIPKEELKSAFRVKFVGEEGVDEGGVRKEFFLLLTRKLLDPSFGMFVQNSSTNLLWFNPDSLETPVQFEFVGILLGLAIYNSVILDVHLPRVLYKMLLGHSPTLEDLKDADPELGTGLQQFLDFDGNVEETFCRTFSLTFEVFGEKKTVDLKPNGRELPVTNVNRQEYVDLYVEYVLQKSVSKQLEAFSQGFHLVCDGEPLRLFRAEELEMVICGSPTLDFGLLEESTKYEDGFTSNSSVVCWFWEVVHDFTDDEKKQFLMFTTGSDRVPLRGLGALSLTISKNGPDSNRLPTSHTCFNHLLLPDYSSKEKLRERLLLAISHSEGFGTM